MTPVCRHESRKSDVMVMVCSMSCHMMLCLLCSSIFVFCEMYEVLRKDLPAAAADCGLAATTESIPRDMTRRSSKGSYREVVISLEDGT